MGYLSPQFEQEINIVSILITYFLLKLASLNYYKGILFFTLKDPSCSFFEKKYHFFAEKL
jgi:hypothetical protein